jgi:hypothetical protein
VLVVKPTLLVFHFPNRTAMQLHESVSESVLIWNIKLIDNWTVHVTISLHRQSSVGSEVLVMGISDAHAHLFPTCPGPFPATAAAQFWNMELLFIRVSEYHLAII